MLRAAPYRDFIATYKCGACGETFKYMISVRYKSAAVQQLTPKLHSCLSFQGSTSNTQGVAHAITLREE